jgi:hypothetical protein
LLRQTPLTFNERSTLSSSGYGYETKNSHARANGGLGLKEEGKEEEATEGEAGWPAWIVGRRQNVGSNRGSMFVYSSEAKPEETGRKWEVWDAEDWKVQRQVRVVEEVDDDSDAIRWMDYKAGLPQVLSLLALLVQKYQY